ncbi:MAG: hypothetical protein LBF15_01720 [Candidatus Peribacteria bacterium]|nr:hypothetical protein [Candidatus Peribacteria bacterium]
MFKINDFDKFELHRNDIENIVNQELEKINDINLTTNQISIYKVNSKFP